MKIHFNADFNLLVWTNFVWLYQLIELVILAISRLGKTQTCNN